MIDPLEQITQQMTSTLDQGEVLAAVTRGLIEDLGAALARIWLIEPGDICSACREAPRCPNRERCLHLQASAGLSTRLDGAHRRVPIGALKIGQIALSREPMCANQIETDERITDKAWVRRNGLASFAGYPLLFQGELLGVLAMFAKRPLFGAELERLSLFANRAAIAIQNARLYTELAALKARLEAENIYLHEELRRGQTDAELIGESPALLEALSKLRQVAPTSSTVLLSGETGTGKELFARALHAASARRGGPLVMVNCAAIAPGLVESELFGHEKGAFTTALGRRIGRFELASGGTLLLDEVGELPLETQAKLLRVLQEREMERVGGSETLRVDVRVVAATNRDLAAEVQRGRFRADLYYRLAVFPIHVPPLRARRSDIPLLCSAFLEKQARALRKPLRGLTKDAEDRLMAYDWPGNVRELHNVIERAAILARGDVIGLDELPDLGRGVDMSGGGPPGLAGAIADPGSAERGHGGETLKEVERDHMMRVLSDTGWVIEGPEGAAARLGMRPSTLRSRMARLGVRRPAGRT
jgi:transcriptional regulator with GAF, ATPase, and Fis domain